MIRSARSGFHLVLTGRRLRHDSGVLCTLFEKDADDPTIALYCMFRTPKLTQLRRCLVLDRDDPESDGLTRAFCARRLALIDLVLAERAPQPML